MNENDDVLTLPVEGDGPDRPGPGSGGGAVALSSEARLATALLLQAQALDGMRQAHSDLLARLDTGGAGAARRTVEELQGALREVREAQQQTNAQLTRARHKASRRTSALAALLVVAALGAAWFVHDSRTEVTHALQAAKAGLSSSVETEREALQLSLHEALAAAGTQQVALLEELVAGMQGTEARLRHELALASAERDDTRAQLAGASQAAESLQAELDAARRAGDTLEQDLLRARDERNRQIGEASRLREQMSERDRQFQELGETLHRVRLDLEARAAAPDLRIVATAGDPDSLGGRVTAALHASGATGAAVLETGPLTDGALTALLVRLTGDDGAPARLLSAESGRLVTEHGRALLRLQAVREQGAEALIAIEDIVLPAVDAAAWSALGMSLPADFVSVVQVVAALDTLLAPHGYRVVRLESFDGLTLGGLELRQEDNRGVWLRTLKAARGEVRPVGPELALEEGSIQVGADERPFFEGQLRVPLPGGDYGAWMAAIASPAP